MLSGILSAITTRRQVLGLTAVLSVFYTVLSLSVLTLLLYALGKPMSKTAAGAAIFVTLFIASIATYKFLSHLRTLNLTRAELETSSRKDYLTGAFNRRYVEESAQQAFSLSKRHGFPVSVILLDLDHFKNVNDTHGHSTGDVVLIELTKCIGTIIRKTDIFGRFGGEEFILFMPHTTLDQASLLAERIRAEISVLQIQTQESQVTTTVSLGVTVVDENTETLDALIINADLALYRAKDNGRNRVEVYNESFLQE